MSAFVALRNTQTLNDVKVAKSNAACINPAMHIAILSRSRFVYSTRRLVEAAKKRGHDVSVVNTLACGVYIDGEQFRLLHHARPLAPIDVVIPRIGTSVTEYGLAVVRQFELMGMPVVNGSDAIGLSRDKLRAGQFMARHKLPTPATVTLRDPEGLDRLVDALGGLPLVVKPLKGTQGLGVALIDSMNSMRGISEMMWGQGQNFLLQRYIKEASGSDLRALVVGDRVIAAMRRKGKDGEFRANIHRGGKGESVELSDEYRELAVRAAQTAGLEVAGVDMLETDNGPVLLEFNSSPGFNGIEKASGVDVADAVIEHAEKLAKKPDSA